MSTNDTLTPFRQMREGGLMQMMSTWFPPLAVVPKACFGIVAFALIACVNEETHRNVAAERTELLAQLDALEAAAKTQQLELQERLRSQQEAIADLGLSIRRTQRRIDEATKEREAVETAFEDYRRSARPVIWKAAEGMRIPELELNDGGRFENAVISRLNPGGISITHESGVARIPFEHLPVELQDKLGFDLEEAQQFRIEEMIASMREEQAMASARTSPETTSLSSAPQGAVSTPEEGDRRPRSYRLAVRKVVSRARTPSAFGHAIRWDVAPRDDEIRVYWTFYGILRSGKIKANPDYMPIRQGTGSSSGTASSNDGPNSGRYRENYRYVGWLVYAVDDATGRLIGVQASPRPLAKLVPEDVVRRHRASVASSIPGSPTDPHGSAPGVGLPVMPVYLSEVSTVQEGYLTLANGMTFRNDPRLSAPAGARTVVFRDFTRIWIGGIGLFGCERIDSNSIPPSGMGRICEIASLDQKGILVTSDGLRYDVTADVFEEVAFWTAGRHIMVIDDRAIISLGAPAGFVQVRRIE